MRRYSLFSTIYFAIGLLVALSHGYNTLTSVSAIVSFILAVFLWPAVLLGFGVHVNLGF